ncbi:MAG TPA: choice-of-anchor R domain-containing protein [Bryobacteraceae bacterium]|jgi:hypothetical protein
MRIFQKAALVSLLAVPGWSSIVLYNNLNGPFPFQGTSVTVQSNVGIAVNFMPSATGTVANVNLPMLNDTPAPIQGIVSIYSDKSGTPGALLETLADTPVLSTTTATLETADATAPVTLNSGVPYWLVVFTTGTSPAHAQWFDNDAGVASAFDILVGSSKSFSVFESVAAGAEVSPAFEINGSPVMAVVPEPGYGAVSLLGLAAVVIVARLRKKSTQT